MLVDVVHSKKIYLETSSAAQLQGDYLKCKRNNFLNFKEGMTACLGASITYHEKHALRVQPCHWAVSGSAGSAKAEQQLCVLSWSIGCAGGCPCSAQCWGSLILSAQYSWLSATAQNPAESLSQDSVCRWNSLCKIWRRCKNPIPIWDPQSFSLCCLSLRVAGPCFDSGIWLRDSSEMFWLIAWQAS